MALLEQLVYVVKAAQTCAEILFYKFEIKAASNAIHHTAVWVGEPFVIWTGPIPCVLCFNLKIGITYNGLFVTLKIASSVAPEALVTSLLAQ